MNDAELRKNYVADEFENAIEYNDETRGQLNEKQQYFADQLVAGNYDVRFNEVHILGKKEGNQAISVLRNNLPE